MNLPEIYDLRDENELISSGETEELTIRQDEFYRLFDEIEQEDDDWKTITQSDHVWEYYEDTFDDVRMKQAFFEKVGEIVSIPSYKYVVKYLMLHYKLAIGEKNMAGLWSYLESGQWEVCESISIEELSAFKRQLNREKDEQIKYFLPEDYKMLLSVLLYYLQFDYKYNGLETDLKWKKYFRKLIEQFDQGMLNDLALALNMEYAYYRVFRKKVLHLSEVNFYDRENILLYLVLRYAGDCGKHQYFAAYNCLKSLYSENKDMAETIIPDSTKAIGRWFEDVLEESGRLKERYRTSLFEEREDGIANIFAMVEAVNSKNSKRSVERIFLAQWKKLETHIEKYEKSTIIEKIRSDKNRPDAANTYVGKQKIYRWLYGSRILRREKNRNVELKEKEMVLLGDGQKEYFLNSKVFLETRIRDNTFSAFPKNEERQRNLLLTLGFLNFVLDSEEGNYLAEQYSERLVDFEIAIYKLFAPCGFLLPHGGNAYDTYIKLLLSCDEPIELFKYVWRMKTGSPE